MNILELLKAYLNIEKSDTSRDLILNSNIRKAEKAIKKYSRLTDDELKNYADEIVDLAMYYHQNKKNIGIKNESEGNRSKSYEIEDIPSIIKSRLPLPKITMF